ncbi:hypothetical protein WILDE_104 [Arthrobacter phage Wilde]|uniref:Uncharacterized protein n=1 Tax=Arthrobacter phage Wilde TaxID=1772323 RepID=A0A0U4JFE4_9CAUD|nr:hypothetical protein WILDE_104 [Arthrobacter phage Wilde]
MANIAYVASLPDCDFCKHDDGVSKPAEYDAKTIYGPWANMCGAHFVERGTGTLGTGYGQQLVVGERPTATHEETQAKVDEAMRHGTIDDVMEAIGDGDPADYFG